MALPKAMDPQTDFSAGELDVQHKRSDDPIMKSGARQMSNWRILNSKRPQQRSGRTALWVDATGRVDEVRVAPGLTFRLQFGNGVLIIRDSNGAILNTSAFGYPWTIPTAGQISWAQVKFGATTDIVMTFDGSGVWLARFDGTTWTFPAFAFQQDAVGPLAPFFRIAAPGITMTPGATTGNTTAVFSAPVLTGPAAAWIGVVFRFANCRVKILTVTDSQHATINCMETIFSAQKVPVASAAGFQVSQIVQGSTSLLQGEVIQVDTVGNFVYVQNTNSFSTFINGETLVGPNSRTTVSGSPTGVPPQAAVTWDEQIVSNARGWPRSCSADQQRLIFSDLPGVPDAGMWSNIALPYNFQSGALASNAFTTIVSDPKGRPRIYHIVAGDGGEFVFTDRGIYYIPISEQNPLTPSSVVFKPVSPDAASPVRPLRTAEAMLYVTAGLNRVVAIVGSGATYSVKPYTTRDVTEKHTHLFTAITALAITTGDGTFAERYVYALRGDGAVIVGRYDLSRDWMGWVPWTGVGNVAWVSALGANVIFTTNYPGASATMVEVLDDTQYVDAGLFVNAIPAALTPPGGKGPLWFAPNTTVTLMDLGTRMMGTYQIDGNGFIVPQNTGGENLLSAQLVAGQPYTPLLEPFVPLTAGGQSVGQRMRRRNVARFAVSVENSTGFVLQTLYSGPNGPKLPQPGAVIQSARVPAWNMGDDPTQPPPLREGTFNFRPSGRSFDPRQAVVKDTPGPLRVVEIGMEVSV